MEGILVGFFQDKCKGGAGCCPLNMGPGQKLAGGGRLGVVSKPWG